MGQVIRYIVVLNPDYIPQTPHFLRTCLDTLKGNEAALVCLIPY